MTDSKKHSEERSGFNRRDFLRGSSAVAAVTALHAQNEVAAQDRGPTIVRGERSIELNVNGENHSVRVEPRTTLLEVLRYQLELTGAKPVSLDGSSGASTVLVDGKPVMASTTLANQVAGKKIQTVEGLASDAVPKAFVANDAQQCGFCTPGFVVAVRAFLNENPRATEEQIRKGLNGNICRCGTYSNIIQAATQIVRGG